MLKEHSLRKEDLFAFVFFYISDTIKGENGLKIQL